MKIVFIVLSVFYITFSFSQNDVNKDNQVELGEFSLSVNVQNIKASLDFYEKIGFTKVPGAGSIESKWIILKNGETTIGLFEGMFSQNTMTFSAVKDARFLHQQMKDNGIEIVYSSGMENEHGPCSFMMLDPDGNPILIDQFKE